MGIVWNDKAKSVGKYVSEATLHPSRPHAFKSSIYIEDEYETAHLKVDFDTHKNPIALTRIVRALSNATHFRHAVTGEKTAFQIVESVVFTTGRGHHLRVWFTAGEGVIPATTILRIQASCGDDPQRQVFNAARVKRGEGGWNVLWRQKWKNGALLSEERMDAELTAELKRRLQPIKDASYARHVKAMERKGRRA
jgi:hypothetical protein